MPNDFAGKRVVVMGLGRFGGGVGVTRWLHGQGARVHVTDLSDEEALAKSLQALKGLDISYRLGRHDEADLDGCALLVVNPAVDKRKASFFHAAVRRGIPWSSEMNLFLERCPGRIVGITGTVGKSTTTAMIGDILHAAKEAPGWPLTRDATTSQLDAKRPSRVKGWPHGQVWLGGNIGKSLLDGLAGMTPRDIVVLELSSFQLEDAANGRRSPHVALITNLCDNHLDRHGTMQAYADAKANIYRFQTADDWLIMPFEGGIEHLPQDWAGHARLVRFGVDPKSRRVRLMLPACGTGFQPLTCGAAPPLLNAKHSPHIKGQPVSPQTPDELDVPLSVPGLHNVQNAAAAMAVSRILDVPDAVAKEALFAFAGLAHRLEFVREFQGVRYYNDSKATTPDAAITSLKAFDCGIVALVGGSDKGSSFAELGRELAKRAKGIICLGDTQEAIRREVLLAADASRPPVVKTASNSQEAVELAYHLAQPGDVVLLSPACASFDWFRNYEERGETFKTLVMGLG